MAISITREFDAILVISVIIAIHVVMAISITRVFDAILGVISVIIVNNVIMGINFNMAISIISVIDAITVISVMMVMSVKRGGLAELSCHLARVGFASEEVDVCDHDPR
jgi:hypothetical protein